MWEAVRSSVAAAQPPTWRTPPWARPARLPLPGQPGMPVNSQTGGVMPAYPTNPGAIGNAPNFPQPGLQMNPQAQNAAAQMIGQILTTPRPGGMPVNNATRAE